MKYKKYVLLLLLVIFIGWNRVEAVNSDKCYYIGDGLKATFEFGKNYQDVYVDFVGDKIDHDSEDILNWRPDLFRGNTTVAGHKFDNLYSNANDAHNNGVCPNYLVIQYCKVYKVWATNDITEAKNAAEAINSVDGCIGKYAGFKSSDGITRITADEYYATFISPNAGGYEIPMDDPERACKEIFGDPDYAGEKDVDADGNPIDTNGNGVIDPPSLAYLINSILKYIRIIVPILIILLGSLDFAKAVVAGKEDEMKKAQTIFVKRLIAGIIVFFVPVIVNLIMQLADIVWDGMGLSHCELP